MRLLLILGLTAAFAVIGSLTRDRWSEEPDAASDQAAATPGQIAEAPKMLELSLQARANMELTVKAAKLQTYWKTIEIPGVINDRPGRTDRGVTAPAVGVVAEVHAFPGDIVRAGDRLFTLRLSSEYLQNSQSELFKAKREIQLLREQLERLRGVAEGAISRARLIELEQQISRQDAAIQALRQDLQARGLTAAQTDEASEGRFVSTIEVVAPGPADGSSEPDVKPVSLSNDSDGRAAYEVQDLKAELGQTVQAGELLCNLANHSALYIEGHAFKREAPYLENAARDSRPIQVEFDEADPEQWPPLEQTFEIQHLASSVDPVTRTFEFFIKLANQSRTYDKDGRTFVVWRFQPGQRVRLRVPVEEFTDVLVLPAAGVEWEGPEAFVFRQNGDLFDRRPVHVLHQDRLNVVVANDGSVRPGWFIAHNAAASLNRVLKAQAASGQPVGVHVHADGTVHGAH